MKYIKRKVDIYHSSSFTSNG